MNFKQFVQRLEKFGHSYYQFLLQENKIFTPNAICIWPEETESFVKSIRVRNEDCIGDTKIPTTRFTPNYPYEALEARAASNNIIDTFRLHMPNMEVGDILRVTIEGSIKEIAVWGYIQE